MAIMMVTAALAALLYGAGAALQQRQAAAQPDDCAGKPRLLARLARNPLWLAGLAAQATGFAAHAAALRSGALAPVQMMVAAELIVAVLLARLWSGQRAGRAAWAAAAMVAAGIAAFLVLTGFAGRGDAVGAPHRVALAAVALSVASAALLAAGLRAGPGRRRALLLAVAAGLSDCVMAIVTLAFARVAGHGPAALASSWTTYALAAGGAGNLLLTQTAYQAGRPMITLPAISAVNPVASVLTAILVLGEVPRLSPASAAGAAAAVLATGAGLAVLARCRPPQAGPGCRPAAPAPPSAVLPPQPPLVSACAAGGRQELL